MTDAEALTYAIDYLRAFQPVMKRIKDPIAGQPDFYWMPPGMSESPARQRWTEAMERLEALRKAAG
jgi:hypothetical protein